MKKKIFALVIGLTLFGIGLYFYTQGNSGIAEEIGVPSDNELLKYFVVQYPDKEVLQGGYEDLNDDGLKDLVVIYRESDRKNGMIVVLDRDDEYEITESVPAPLENQVIEFKNIDEKDEIEMIVSGSKDGRYGYAIFRVQGLEIRNLFGQGMEDCC